MTENLHRLNIALKRRGKKNIKNYLQIIED